MPHGALVTGLGVWTSNAASVEDFAAALRTGKSGIGYRSQDGLGVAGRLNDTPFSDRLASSGTDPRLAERALRAGRRAPRSAQAGLVVAAEAWTKAFGGETAYAAERVGLYIAGNNINQAYQLGVLEKFRESPEYVPASYALHYMDTDQVGLLSEVFSIRGEGATIGGASASGNVALLQASRLIQSGSCDACMVVGAMADLSPVELRAFNHSGALGGRGFSDTPAKASRPFDKARNGFVYGQGCACIILENEEKARDRGAPTWGRLLGGALCLDGNRSSNPSAEGEARAMEAALRAAGRRREQVDYVNAHGTGSLLGDETEVAALKKVFGPHVTKVSINSTKGLTGHCLYAAGVVEAVATVIQLKQGFLHPNANLENPIDNECGFLRLTVEGKESRLALSNSFGFGGINTSLVLEKTN